jgi:hypothetical protein
MSFKKNKSLTCVSIVVLMVIYHVVVVGIVCRFFAWRQLLWSFLVNFWAFDSLLGCFLTISDCIQQVSNSFVVLKDRQPCLVLVAWLFLVLDKDNWSCVWIFPILGKDRWVCWFFDQFMRFALSLIWFRPSFLGFCSVHHLSHPVALVLYCSLCFVFDLVHFRSGSVVFRPVSAFQVSWVPRRSGSIWLQIGSSIFCPV